MGHAHAAVCSTPSALLRSHQEPLNNAHLRPSWLGMSLTWKTVPSVLPEKRQSVSEALSLEMNS